MFYEAHDVLEELWLRDRASPNYGFYKGLIQLAGAFVHLQKNRLRPAASLFNLAEANLLKYPSRHEHLEVTDVLALVREWREILIASDFTQNPLTESNTPTLNVSGDKLDSQPPLVRRT